MRTDSWAGTPLAQTAPTWPSGTYVSAYFFSSAGPPAATNFGTWRGSPVNIASSYGTYDTFAHVIAPQGMLGGWAGSPWAANNGAGFALAVGMVPTGTAIPATATTYNSNWATFATNLVGAGFGNCIIRLGWEFNGGWYPWAATDANASQWVAYWQQIVTTLRAGGFTGKFCWNVNRGPSSVGLTDPTTVYPGSSYVDIIGVDSYDNASWASQTGGSQGLTYWYNYAVTAGKTFAVPEWGNWLTFPAGNGDNPQYVSNMRAWFAAAGSSLNYEALFNNPVISLWPFALTPQSAVMYQSLWGH